MSEVDDDVLVRRAQGGGPDARAAFDELARRHAAWLVRYLYHLLGDVGLADDAAQDSLLRAYTSLHRLREPAKLKAWLRQIATRTAFNARRSRATRGRYEDQAREPTRLPGAHEVVSAEESLSIVLDQMSYGYREILVMRYIEELDMDEIGEALDLGASACKMRLKRARDEFKLLHERVVHDR